MANYNLRCLEPEKLSVEYVQKARAKNHKYNMQAVESLSDALKIEGKIVFKLVKGNILDCSDDIIVSTNNAFL